MRLFLCEKPSQARDLAAVLGSPVQPSPNAGFLETSLGLVTWASGHLLELEEPGEIDKRYLRWDPADLPIIPDDIYYLPKAGAQQQLDVIGGLLKESTNVVLATDAEREGELIGRNILNHHAYTGPLLRLWLKGLDPASIQHALDNLLPGTEKEPLFHSAITRAKSDWLVGMNASRAATIALGGRGRTMPVGRVQTPTLSIIVSRDQQIKAFTPTPFATLDITVAQNPEHPQTLKWVPPTPTPSAAEAQAAQHAAESTPLTVEISTEPITQPPPPLFNLSGLQEKACQAWGWSAFQTLSVLQRMYEHHKVLSYPRSDSTVLPQEQAAQIPTVLGNLASTPLAPVCPSAPVIRPEVFVQDLGSAHHAIIPTTLPVDLKTLSPEERKVYLLVAKSYLAAVLPDYQANKVTANIQTGSHHFTASGEVTTDKGWKVLSTIPAPNPPSLVPGPATLTGTNLNHTQTVPPAPYTDGTLVHTMVNVGKTAASSEGSRPGAGLGTEATRANTIEGLIKSGMLERNGPVLTSTPKAQDLITQLRQHAPLLVDPAETAIWEDGLKKIEEGALPVPVFMDGIKKRVQSHVSNLLGIEKPKRDPADVTEGSPINFSCPVSNLPVRETPKGWVFPGAPDAYCPKVLAGREMEPLDYAEAISGKPVLLGGFVSRQGREFAAALVLNKKADGFDFDFNPVLEGPSTSMEM